MTSHPQSPWLPRLAAFALAALAAACAVYWGLKWPGQQAGNSATPVAAQDAPAIDPVALARVLGGGLVAPATPVEPVASVAASRLTLVGVVATSKQAGTALISVDGKPARPYRVGAKVEEGLVLQSVGPRRASLSASVNGPPSITIELPLLTKR
jgi:general secretion pathway protein C